jgi:hypothetical protein
MLNKPWPHGLQFCFVKSCKTKEFKELWKSLPSKRPYTHVITLSNFPIIDIRKQAPSLVSGLLKLLLYFGSYFRIILRILIL